MKRYILLLGIVVFTTSFAFSQVGVGARGIFGMDGGAYGGVEFSIQKPCQYELDLGLLNDSWKATGLKHWAFVEKKNLGLYGGGGIGLGYYDQFNEMFGTFALNLGTYLMLGHLQVGLDWRPEWNFFNAPDQNLSFNMALSARWVFKK